MQHKSCEKAIEMEIGQLSIVIAAISAFGSAIAAGIMFLQMRLTKFHYDEQLSRIAQAQERENEINEVQNKILINQMWNNLNSIVLKEDHRFHARLAERDFDGVEPDLIPRIYWHFMSVNIVEVAWLLKGANAIEDDTADSLIEDLSKILRRDPEAVQYVLSGRGYSSRFLEALWPKVFGKEYASSIAAGRARM